MSYATFNRKSTPNHRLAKRMVGVVASYDWANDIDILSVRAVLNMRLNTKECFINAISAVAQCLVAHTRYTPTKISDNQRALFYLPEFVTVTKIAKLCSISTDTVYRVFAYLTAIGDLETGTYFIKESDRYISTKVFLKSSIFTRCGFAFQELQKAIQSLTEKCKERVKKEDAAYHKTSLLISKALRKGVKSRLTKDTERVLSIIPENKPKSDTNSDYKTPASTFIAPIMNKVKTPYQINSRDNDYTTIHTLPENKTSAKTREFASKVEYFMTVEGLPRIKAVEKVIALSPKFKA